MIRLTDPALSGAPVLIAPTGVTQGEGVDIFVSNSVKRRSKRAKALTIAAMGSSAELAN